MLAKANSALPGVASWRELMSQLEESGAPSRMVDAGERVRANCLTTSTDAKRRAGPTPSEALRSSSRRLVADCHETAIE